MYNSYKKARDTSWEVLLECGIINHDIGTIHYRNSEKDSKTDAGT